MKKYFLVSMTLLLSALVFGQTNRFVYVVSMKSNSNKPDDVKKELAYLDTDGKQSLFIAENVVKADSIMTAFRKTNVPPTAQQAQQMEGLRSTMRYVVKKDLVNGEVTFQNRIGRDSYSYTENNLFAWKIEPETMKIDKYNAQKATADFGGRKWTAWFTSEIPVSDGPYKFGGLPGLILKVEDEKGDYKFEMAESKKIAAVASVNQFGQIIKVKKKDYDKVAKRFQEDPESFMMANRGAGGRGGVPAPPSVQGGGRVSVSGGQGSNFRQRMLQEIKDNNNPIELQ